MSTTFIATMLVKSGKEAEFERLQKELSADGHATEPDMYVYDVIKHRTVARSYVVYARFKDQAAFDAHMKTPAHDRLVPPILACLEKDMDLQFYDWKS